MKEVSIKMTNFNTTVVKDYLKKHDQKKNSQKNGFRLIETEVQQAEINYTKTKKKLNLVYLINLQVLNKILGFTF